MDIRRPVFLKLRPQNVAVISDKYVAVISYKYIRIPYNTCVAVLSDKYVGVISYKYVAVISGEGGGDQCHHSQRDWRA